MNKLDALFVHDHRFLIDKNKIVYSPGKLSYATFSEYLKTFDNITIIGRKRNINGENINSINVSSGENISFIFVPDISSPFKLIRYGLLATRIIGEHVKKSDAVISRTSLLGFIAALSSIRFGIPWATEVVGCPFDALWNYGGIVPKISAPIYYFLQKQIVRKAPFALYVTNEFLQRRYPNSGHSSGISDVSIPFSSGDLFKQRMKRVLQPGKPFVFGMIASLNSKWKGIQTALSAIKYCKNLIPNFEFRILGDGDNKRWLELAKKMRVENCVRFCGTLPSGEAVFKWLDSIDVYLQPSLQEGLPRSLVEAMSRGCPAIGSRVGGIPELLEESVLHKPNDIKHLSELIIKSFKIKWRMQQTKRNFNVSKKYQNDALAVKREAFWQQFYQYAINIKPPKSK